MGKRIYTSCCNLNSQGNTDAYTRGFLHAGRLTRDEAIRLTREYYAHVMKCARQFLDTPVDELRVQVQRGEFRVEVIEVLAP